MNRRIRVRALRKEEPDIRLYVLALIALVRQFQEQEDGQQAQAAATPGEEVTDERG